MYGSVTNIGYETNPPSGTSYIRIHVKCFDGYYAFADFVKYEH